MSLIKQFVACLSAHHRARDVEWKVFKRPLAVSCLGKKVIKKKALKWTERALALEAEKPYLLGKKDSFPLPQVLFSYFLLMASARGL
jgi:hypothetical protein